MVPTLKATTTTGATPTKGVQIYRATNQQRVVDARKRISIKQCELEMANCKWRNEWRGNKTRRKGGHTENSMDEQAHDGRTQDRWTDGRRYERTKWTDIWFYALLERWVVVVSRSYKVVVCKPLEARRASLGGWLAELCRGRLDV